MALLKPAQQGSVTGSRQSTSSCPLLAPTLPPHRQPHLRPPVARAPTRCTQLAVRAQAAATAAPPAEASTASTANSTAARAAATAANTAKTITTFNDSRRSAVWTSDLPLRRLPRSLDSVEDREAAARHLPGYWPAAGPGPICATTGHAVDFRAAERSLLRLMACPDLDAALLNAPPPPHSAAAADGAREDALRVDRAVAAAVSIAYGRQDDDTSHPLREACHTFLQRTLYRINRLNHFWYDDLSLYDNERSEYLSRLRNRVEARWQAWEEERLGMDRAKYTAMSAQELKSAVRAQAAIDVDPPLSDEASYIRHDMSLQGYKHLLAVGSLDGLVEASRQARVCSGAANEVSTAVFRVLMEGGPPQEYGSGRLSRKHSTFYLAMMRQVGLDERLEGYLDLVPWQWLASGNHNFFLTERRRNYLRYNGGLTYFEVNGPAVYRTYCMAAQRLGLPDSAWGYWELHVREDERHGRQMVEEVACPLIDRYCSTPGAPAGNASGSGYGWEVLWGYDQEVAMGARAGQALVHDIRAMEAEAAEEAAERRNSGDGQ